MSGAEVLGAPSAPTSHAATSGLVVGRARAAIAYTQAREEIGVSIRELADRLGVSHSVPDRWEANADTGNVEKPVPLGLLFTDGAPVALVIGIVERVFARIGQSSAVAMMQGAMSRIERSGLAERDRAALMDLYDRLHRLLFRGSR